jgi:hypothetical protein
MTNTNKAYCSACGYTIESLHPDDYVECQCKTIAVDGGLSMKCYAKDWSKFYRVNDLGERFPVQIQGNVKPLDNMSVKPTRTELMKMLRDMIESYERLPPIALYQPVTNADLYSALLLLEACLSSTMED